MRGRGEIQSSQHKLRAGQPNKHPKTTSIMQSKPKDLGMSCCLSGAPPRYMERERERGVLDDEDVGDITSESATRSESLHKQKVGTTYGDPDAK